MQIAQVIHKKIEAYKTEISPIIDGVIEPELWSHLPKAKNWSQLEPKNGEPERLNQKSEVQFMYNDRALYIGAMFYDSSHDSIFTEFSLRDEENKTVIGLEYGYHHIMMLKTNSCLRLLQQEFNKILVPQ